MKTLKSQFLIFLFLIMWSLSAHSQISLGLKAGINSAHQVTEFNGVELSTESINGIVLGALLEIPLSQKVSLQPEFLYMQKGSSLEPLDDRLKINYLEIPILFKFKFLNKKSFGLNLVAGPSFGYASSGTISDGSGSESLDFDDDTIERMDIPLQLGLGASTSIGGATLFTEYRYWRSLVNISKSDEVTLNNSGFSAVIGVLFPLGSTDSN